MTMKQRTLLSDRLYFGLDPMRLRASAHRALARLVGLPPDRARISATNLRQDFAVDTIQGATLVEDMVAGGLLEPPASGHHGYAVTPEFIELAAARIVEPLPRARARKLLADACALAERINDEAVSNPLRIEAFVVYGDYMSRSHRLDQLNIGIVVAARAPSLRTRFGRMQSKADGAESIRAAFRDLSSFVHVRLVTDRRSLPRPFSLVFDADAER
jgi:hypothetical protein